MSSSGSKKTPSVIFVLGGPGAGKGTQCANMVKYFGFVHLSAGDLLREEQQRGTEHAKSIQEHIKNGTIVPVEITVALIKEAMQRHMANGAFNFLVDGFPRNQNNLDGWNQQMNGFAEVLFCLVFDCSEKVMRARLLKRGETSGRADDNEASILKRFQTFKEQTQPIIHSFEKLGKMRLVSAEGSQEEVFAAVCEVLKGFALVQNTFAFIKPDVVRAKNDELVLKRIHDEGFKVVAQKRVHLTKEQAETFYAEHKGRGFFNDLVAFMTSGEAVALALEKVDAIKAWRALCGPTRTEEAKKNAPNSLRALFGTDATMNACHGSDSVDSATRELALMFPEVQFPVRVLPKAVAPAAAATH